MLNRFPSRVERGLSSVAGEERYSTTLPDRRMTAARRRIRIRRASPEVLSGMLAVLKVAETPPVPPERFEGCLACADGVRR